MGAQEVNSLHDQPEADGSLNSPSSRSGRPAAIYGSSRQNFSKDLFSDA
jgi:hypothetical protein